MNIPLFILLMDFVMSEDDLIQLQEYSTLHELLDRMARHYGYSDWIAAWHANCFDKDITTPVLTITPKQQLVSEDDGLEACDSCDNLVPEDELEWFETAHMTLESPAEGVMQCQSCRDRDDDYAIDAYLARMDEEVYVSDYDYN